MEKRWVVEPAAPEAVCAALSAAGYPPLVSQLLYTRGLTDPDAAQRFLNGQLSYDDNPQRLLGMPAAVDRLRHALQHDEQIVVYGDYDTDGVTATALLVQVLSALGGRVAPFIPDREEDGYGLSIEAFRKVREQYAPKVVVTVDCGVRSLAEAEEAKRLGIDLIITDHHLPGPELPQAYAVINPKQPGDEYPEKYLAGVGLAYKLAQALVRPMAPPPPINGSHVLDLVALGTVADIAPLTGENRVLVRLGLGLINRPRRVGLRALMDVARLKVGTVDAGSIGYSLGPRLNAAGRLESALDAYHLLTTSDLPLADSLARKLELQNRERQELTRLTHLRAREVALETHGEGALLFAADASFRSGVIGLAAARLAEEFYRPAVVASRDERTGLTKGSARSIPEFDITAALDECAHLMERHGGHAAAAGFTVRAENEAALADALRQVAARELDGKDLRPTLRIDADEVPLSALTWELHKWLAQFEPCGFHNRTPVFASRGVRVVNSRAVGADGRHLKLTVTDGRAMYDAIAFGQAEWLPNLPPYVDLAYCLEANEWNGERRLQLNVRDIKRAAG